MSACPLDGSTRQIIDRDDAGVIWRCPLCGQVGREEHEGEPE